MHDCRQRRDAKGTYCTNYIIMIITHVIPADGVLAAWLGWGSLIRRHVSPGTDRFREVIGGVLFVLAAAREGVKCMA